MAIDNLRLIERNAEAFLKEHNMEHLPVDPFLIAELLDITVQAKPITVEGVSGMLVREGDAFGILYATHICSEGFKRFSVAHELGHYLLPGHIDHIFPNGSGFHESRSGFISADQYEREADLFAASLLMPDSLFRQSMGRMGEGLSAIEKLAELCQTSLTSTAIRYIQRTELPEAVILSAKNLVDFCFMSDALKVLGKGKFDFLRKETPLPRNSETLNFNNNPLNVQNSERVTLMVSIQDWFGGNRDIEAEEQIIGLGGYGKTLTIISVLNIVDEEENEDEDDSNWNRRMKRHY